MGHLTFGIGYLEYESGVNLGLVLGLALGLGIPVLCGVVAALVLCFCYRKYKHKKVQALRNHMKARASDSVYVSGQG